MLFEYHELLFMPTFILVFAILRVFHWLNYSTKVPVHRSPHCHVRHYVIKNRYIISSVYLRGPAAD